MFGLIVSGRLVQTDFQQISPTQFMITVPDADNINHLVVFLTGAVPFPDGFGGSVYFSWPNPSAPPSWQLLGFVTNAKPSSIYKITKLKNDPAGMSSSASSFGFGQQSSHNAQIGISIEPLQQIASQSPNAITEPSNTSTFLEFAERAVQNLFDYVASFAVSQSQMTPNPNEIFVPMSVLRNWYANFSRKLQLNPQFWRS
uniref:EOG090X0D82 n=1 Tax=Alona affinis TaxID=381656 RepID=A0A9N6ZEM7_9CRUS|nr:EOG090X0D82 [Alona affinis]